MYKELLETQEKHESKVMLSTESTASIREFLA
jgi:hypothetical protein